LQRSFFDPNPFSQAKALRQLDYVAPQPHPTLRLEHHHQHADLLARYLGADSGLTGEWAGDRVSRVS
jgi:hypothetical protein